MAGTMHDERIDRLFWNARYLRFRASPKRIKKRVVRLRFNGEFVGCDPFLMPGIWCSGDFLYSGVFLCSGRAI
ncbi:hypothetical protein HMPREF2674_03030 [Rothia sp. HMSC062F03]|nr:hypothetical protein HMPREF2674_03030 [Rothia sp. HMSC062F03]